MVGGGLVNIPSFLLQHQITLEPYLGQSANGPTYGPPIPVRALVDEQTREIRDPHGDKVVSGATVYCRLDGVPVPGSVVIPVLSRVTLADGRQTRVIQTYRHDGGNLGTPNHLEINLQ